MGEQTVIYEYMLTKLVREGLLTEEQSKGTLQYLLSMMAEEIDVKEAA